jgi:hypothetical protein
LEWQRQLTRDVQFAGGTASLFDKDDLVRSVVRFCLHGLNIFLRVRPLPDELEYYLGVSSLTGKFLQNSLMVEKPLAVPFQCRTLGRPDRAFKVMLKDEAVPAVDSLRENLLTTLNGILGAFDALAPANLENSSSRVISSNRFAASYEDSLSRLSLRWLSAVRGVSTASKG